MTNFDRFRSHTELADQLLEAATHHQLTEALQILALNLVAYKAKYGEIPQADIVDSLQRGRVDESMAAMMADTMAQLCGVLRTVMARDQPARLN